MAPKRISAFSEMPYDETLLDAIRIEGENMDPSPMRDAYRILGQTIQMDFNRGGVLRGTVLTTIYKELERLLDSGHSDQMRKAGDLKEILQELITRYKAWVGSLENEIAVLRSIEQVLKRHGIIAASVVIRRSWKELIEAQKLLQNKIDCDQSRLDLLEIDDS